MKTERAASIEAGLAIEDLLDGSFAFGGLPAGSFGGARSAAFTPIGLGRLQPAGGRFRQAARTAPGACLLPAVVHAHVHTVALDLSPMDQPATKLNWLAELQMLADDPDSPAVIGAFRDRLPAGAADRPSARARLVRSRGLLRRTGQRLPVSDTYEHISTVIPLVPLLRTSPRLAGALGRCLASRDYQPDFLLACVEEVGLAEQTAMVAATPEPDRARVIDALFGHIDLDGQGEVIIALSLP